MSETLETTETTESLQAKEQKVDEFIDSLGDLEFWTFWWLFRSSTEKEIKNFLMDTEFPKLTLFLPRDTAEKIIKFKLTLEIPWIEKILTDTKEKLDEHGKKIEIEQTTRDTKTETQELEDWRYDEEDSSEDEKMPELPGPRPDIPTREDFVEWTEIPEEKVQKAWNYIDNNGVYYSPTLGRVRRGKGEYKHVCTTGAWNVLHLLTWYPLPSNLNIDRTGERLNAMNCYKIHEAVNPTNPSANGYTPKNGDVAVRPRFTLKNWKQTQHMACYINGHWVSDTIQNRMSCYNATQQKERNPGEPNVQIYRFWASWNARGVVA